MAKKAAAPKAPSSSSSPTTTAVTGKSTPVAKAVTPTTEHDEQEVEQMLSEDDMDAQTARVIDQIVAKEPAFLQWFVQVYVPAMAQSLGDVDDDADFDSEQFVRDGYKQWAAAGKPHIDGPRLSS